MNDRLKALLSVAWRFSSNEDEFGIFLQGVVVGAIVTTPDAETDAAKAAMHEPASMVDALNATNNLYESYLTSKRVVEAIRLEAPQFMSALRSDAINAVRHLAEKKKGG